MTSFARLADIVRGGRVSIIFPISVACLMSIVPHDEMRQATESNDLILVTERDSNHKTPLNERIRKNIAIVRWKEVVTTAIIVVDLFLLYVSISLIGVFFPAEVRGDSYVYQVIAIFAEY